MEGDSREWQTLRRLHQFQSTPSGWRETVDRLTKYHDKIISIHSLRVEGDAGASKLLPKICHFNPLPPGGGRRPFRMDKDAEKLFQSTPSGWRETNVFRYSELSISNFNPLPPGGGRPASPDPCHDLTLISIHSLRVEGDVDIVSIVILSVLFQSTPSGWRETKLAKNYKLPVKNFNPLPPGGGRQQVITL